jgi:hypothetical protein
MCPVSKRKAISKTTRFEVFKRDSFTCQYCGGKAPECILQVDHIDPVARGGGNEILNLVTACVVCNSGKGARALSDATAVAKQHAQLAELQERREQLEMLMQWKTALAEMADTTTGWLVAHWTKLTEGFGLSETGRSTLARLVREFSFDEVTTAIDSATAARLVRGSDGKFTHASAVEAFAYVTKVVKWKRKAAENPMLDAIYHARSIARKRCAYYFNEGHVLAALQRAWDGGVSAADLRAAAARCRTVTDLQSILDDLCAKASGVAS